MSNDVTNDAKSEAFSLIHDYALEILNDFDDLPKEVENRLDTIIALARYQFDVRDVQEKQRFEERKNRQE